MDLSYFKKAIAGMSAAAISLTQVGVAFAAYSDVPAGVWYADAVGNFVAAGYLDDTQSRFRGSELANRAEFVKLVVELNGGILSTPPAVASFDDVDTSAWYYGYFEEAGKEGWVRGDGNCYGSHPCYARPAASINRAEAVALITRSFALEGTGSATQFVDNPSGQWYTDVVQTAADHCVLQGDGATGRVRPGDNMNRAEMIVMLDRVDQGLTYGVDCGTGGPTGSAMITDVVATSATTVEVEFNVDLDRNSAEDEDNYSISPDVAVNSAVLFGSDVVELTLGQTLDPNRDYTLTAEDVATTGGSDVSDSMGFAGFSPVVLGDGVLEASISASNPSGDTVPKGAVGVVMLSVDLTASCDDSVVVEDVTVLHEGYGDEANISGLYAAIDGARVTRKRTIDSEDQTADLRFSSPLVIDPCETVTVDIVADFASGSDNASEEHNLVLELASDVVSNALSVGGNFPVRGETFRVAAISSGTVSVEYRSVTPTQIEVGDNAAVIGKFEVSVNSVEDQTLYSMTLEQDSSASDGDFTNIAIRRTDGTILTNTVSSTVGDFVTLVFDPPFTVLEGDKITLEVIADIVGGAGDNIQMTFEESSDVFAVGSLYGYGVNGQLYGSQITIATPGTGLPSSVSIDAGEFTIGVDGPATQDYTRDDNDAVLANIEFQTGGEKIDVKDLFILVEAETSSGQALNYDAVNATSDTVIEVLEDVEIRNKATGRTVSAVAVSSTHEHMAGKGTVQIYRFDDFIIHGDETWEFRVDFIDNGASAHPESGDQFRIHICGEPKSVLVDNALTTNTTKCDFGGMITTPATAYQMDVEGLSTGDAVGDVRPRGNISGNFHEIANASLTVAVKSLNADDSSVENAKDITLLRFEARAGEAEDILFTKAVFEAAGGSLNNIQNYALWVDTDGDGAVDTILEDGVANQSSAVSFTDLAGGGFVVPAEKTVIFEVHGDVASSLTGASPSVEIRFDTGATTMIEAEELDDGSNLSGITVTGGTADVTLPSGATTTDIDVTYVASTTWALSAQGNLYVTKDSTPVRSRQLLGGSLSEPILRLQFRAENEDVDVTDIQVTSSGSNATSVESLELYLEGASTPFATANEAGCASNALSVNPGDDYDVVQSFCANMENQQFIVPEGEDLDVLVRARMKADTAGGTSNQTLEFFLDEYPSSSTGSVRARGAESSNDLIANNANSAANGEVFIGRSTAATTNLDIIGSENVSVLAKIESITNANPDADNTNVPTGITAFGQFKVSAASHSNSNNGLNDVVLSGIVFNVNATNVELDEDMYLYNKADSTVKHTCVVYGGSDIASSATATNTASGAMLVVCEAIAAGSVNTEIDAGSNATFVLQADVTNSQVSASATSTLQASLQEFDDRSQTTFGITSGNSHIEWVDDDSASSDPEFKWVEYPETNVNSTSYKS